MLTEFSQGCNSGVAPILLPKSSAAFAINTTFRGGYATHRPPYIKLTLTFPSVAVEVAVTTGFYQGGGWYRPDFGPLQIVAQISGRLFTFTKGTGAGEYVVAEISIPGDLNSTTATQVWMWQSEKWLIITDGTAALPIFYDGATSRRSYGPSVELVAVGDISATNPAAPPAIGGVVELTLTTPYTGPYNVPVLFNGEFYQTVESSSGGYDVILTNVSDTPGASIAANSPVQILPAAVGYSNGSVSFFGTTDPSPTGYKWACNIDASVGAGLSIGDLLLIGGYTCEIGYIFVVGSIMQLNGPVNSPTPPSSFSLPAGTLIQRSGVTDPNVTIGNTLAIFTVPAVGATVIVGLTAPFTGADGTVVWIGTEQYTIANPPPPGPSTTLYLINLTDASTTDYDDPPGTLATLNILSVPELPAGRMGAYGLCQNWMSLTDGISFIAGDIVGSSAGTQANDYRDAVLKTTGQTFFGGKFRLPGSGTIINSITFTANLDVSLGQGAVQIGTDSSIFACLAPFDFQNPPANNIPILTESLIGFGPLAQNSTIVANSDIIFRNFVGLGSLKLARREFQGGEWGNTPISREMTRTYQQDNQSLLPYGSSVVFDNRLLNTAAPNASAQGVFHMGLVALNFDLISSLRGKSPPIYDGLWTGLNTLQIINIQSGSESRSFVFGSNLTTSKIEMYELLNTEDAVYYDNGTTPIKWVIETPILFNKDVKPMEELVRLTDGEIWLQDIVGNVHVKIQYRPDFYSGSQNPGCWADWIEFDVCAEATGTNIRPGYRTRLGLGEPSGDACEAGNNRPLRVGHFFQVRLEFTGTAKFMALRLEAVTQPVANFAAPVCSPTCSTPALPELVIP